jgi:hypothetical protein
VLEFVQLSQPLVEYSVVAMEVWWDRVMAEPLVPGSVQLLVVVLVWVSVQPAALRLG